MAEEEKKEERKPMPPLEETEAGAKGPKVGCGSKTIILTKPDRTAEA